MAGGIIPPINKDVEANRVFPMCRCYVSSFRVLPMYAFHPSKLFPFKKKTEMPVSYSHANVQRAKSAGCPHGIAYP